MASKSQHFIAKYDCQHIKRYPTAPVKRIYARKILVPIVKQSKAQVILARILEG